MENWILILSVILGSEKQNELRDPSVNIIDGFSSYENCINKGNEIAAEIMSQQTKLRAEMKVEKKIVNGVVVNFPVIETSCIKK